MCRFCLALFEIHSLVNQRLDRFPLVMACQTIVEFWSNYHRIIMVIRVGNLSHSLTVILLERWNSIVDEIKKMPCAANKGKSSATILLFRDSVCTFINDV